MSTLYEDTPLHIDASTNIRLLEIIQADDETAPIACTLRVIALQKSPKYTALSYVWGPPTPARDILVNGKPSTVRENLWNFLHQARRDRRTCAFWIDAICIDQDSDPERTHQVSMMGKIYSEAELVIAWLGTATKYSAQWERAMKTIPAFKDDEQGKFKRWYKVYGPSIMDLLDSPYWSRVWIMQEYNLARQIILQCGPHKTTGELVSLLFDSWYMYSKYHRIKKRPGFQMSLAIGVIHDYLKLLKGDNFAVFVAITYRFSRRRLCADRRDRVYALLGLCDSQKLGETPITPDYSRPILELYAQLVRMVLNDEVSGEIFKAMFIVTALPEALMLEKNELEGLDRETMHILEKHRKVCKENGINMKN